MYLIVNADNTIEIRIQCCIVDMYNDQFNCEEWFTSLHTCDKPVVDKIDWDNDEYGSAMYNNRS